MTPELRHPRRKDRGKGAGWIRAFLRRGAVGVLATVDDGRPVALPLLYAYDEARQAVYMHTALRGRTRRTLEGDGGPASLTVFEMGRLLPADEAAEFGLEYASVVVSGTGVVVEEAREAELGLRLLMEKYAPHLEAGRDYRPTSPEDLARTAVLRLDIREWSGKEKAEGPDYPGAYRFRDVLRG